MKWMQWIANWFGGRTKSLGTLGIGLRAALSGGAPGGWASDHREETAHNTCFNYVAIHAIASQVAGATVTVFADGDQQSQRQSRRKSLAVRVGSFARWKSTYGADDRETDPLPTTHPLVRLLKRPNPYESGASFRYRQAQQIRLTGTCLIWNVPSVSGPTCERYVIPTAMASPVAPTSELPRGGWRISPVASRYSPIVDQGYVDCPSWYRILGQIVDARQVQLIRLPHAWYLDDGQSPLSAGAKWVDASEAVDAARYHQLKNGIDPSVVWNLPPDVSPDQDEIDRVQAKISAKYGGPENVGRVMVAQSGTSITPLSTSPKDMCYTEGFHDFKAAILALHQTPPVAVGLQEPGAYAAYNASMKAWRHAAVQPLCDMLAESDTEHLAPQFGNGLTVEIESDTVDDTELLELQLQNDLAAKVRTKNEWRAVRGLPPLPGSQGDALIGTDSGSLASHSSPEPEGSNDDAAAVSIDTEQPQSKSRRMSEVLSKQMARQPSDVSNETSQSDNAGHCGDLPLGSCDDDEFGESEIVRAGLIADILYGLLGSPSPAVLESLLASSRKTFDPVLHPRDDRGRFVLRGSHEALASARHVISRILQGEIAVRTDPRVLESLCLLTRSQLESLHREHGVTAPPRLRDHLVESIMVRLLKMPDSIEGNKVPSKPIRPSRSGGVDVYVQNADELNRIVNRQMTREQWGQLVGAQPGSRVHVYKRGIREIEIAIEHPDYSARRLVRESEIINSEFDVHPEKQGQGIGVRVLSQQVKAATQLNFQRISAMAVGIGAALRDESENPPIGYYVWARLGFDARIAPLMRRRLRDGTEKERATVADFHSNFPDVKWISEMMLTKKRRDWWKKFGGEFEGTFNLRRRSKSPAVLEAYLAEKVAEKKEKSLDAIRIQELRAQIDDYDQSHCFGVDPERKDVPLFDQSILRGEIPDRLTAEDEVILDRIWDQIGRNAGVGSE